MIEDKNTIQSFYNTHTKSDLAYIKNLSFHRSTQGFTHHIIHKLFLLKNNDYLLKDNKLLDPDSVNILYNYNII